MKVIIFTGGSRGDVQPYVALGQGFKAAGHTVTVLAATDFQTLITEHGLDFVATSENVEAFARQLQTEGGNMLKLLAIQGKAAVELARRSAAVGLDAAKGADLLVAGLGGIFTAAALAEKLAIPLVPAYLYPFAPTRAFASILTPLPQTPVTTWANRSSHHVARQMMWQTLRSADAQARTEVLGLRPAPLNGPFGWIDRHSALTLYGYSPAVLPRPADWDAHSHVTGYWFLDRAAAWQPPADLLAFLAEGPPPVYIGFGSMASRNPRAATELAIAALRASGQRGILYGGWGGLHLEELPSTVHVVGSIPHTWLFERMAAIVHHGGAGTTSAGLAAGVPSIVTPFFADQPFWAQRVYELGVGPRPIPRSKLTADALAAAIRAAVSDDAMRERAAVLGTRIRAEDGIRTAVQRIDEL
jgi:UDP:flavonoid glycosyltransferase YjiC (YdhE family)